MICLNGFLLSWIKYGDSDAVLHFFTEEEGYQTFFFKGIFSPKNKNKSLLIPLQKISITCNKKGKTGIYSISRLENLDQNDEFEVKSNAVIFFISSFLNQILRNENSNEIIYQEIISFKNELSQKNFQSHLIFLLQILKIHGISPLINSDYKFLNPESGHFEREITQLLLNSEISDIWKNILQSENPYEVKIHPKLRKNFLDSCLVYYKYHFTDFRTPQSLEIIQQIFE